MSWAVPNWYALALLALAAFRIYRLIGKDDILDPARQRILERFPSKRLAEFMDCPWCAGAWLSIGWWLTWQAWPHWTLVAATPCAISAAVGLIASNFDPE